MKKTRYALSILLSAVLFIAALGLGYVAITHFGELSYSPISVMLPAAGAVICAICLIPAEKFRRSAREATRYDQYGRRTSLNKYNKMSVKEQKELDRVRMMEMERILSYTQVLEMTHKGSEHPEEDMKKLTGLQNVKEKMEEMAARMQFDQENGVKRSGETKHMCFFGPPGTGKTTCARIMAGYLYKYGYIPENRVIECNGGFLTDANAPKKVEAIVQRAFGGVLFIDEAYSLGEGYFGPQAVAALIKQLEDNKDKFILILAGYEKEMKELLNSNPGFLSRIKEYFFFQSYSVDELSQIFQNMASAEGYTISPEADLKFRKLMSVARMDRNFGNARTCRNVLEKSLDRHSLNYRKRISPERNRLEEQDIVYEQVSLFE